jgi:hypothetical protein
MYKCILLIGLILVIGCSPKKAVVSSELPTGDTRTKEVVLIDDITYLLTEFSDDKTYGYDKANPVKVGGAKESIGPKNERRFLNGLLGPNGERIEYSRVGSCCHFTTPNGVINNTGLLDIYRITWKGSPDTLSIYLNMYDKGDLKIPVGLTAKKP